MHITRSREVWRAAVAGMVIGALQVVILWTVGVESILARVAQPQEWTASGRVSVFGGPSDSPQAGNRRSDWESEGLALYEMTDLEMLRRRGLEMAGSSGGLARRLDPRAPYIAARWPPNLRERLRRAPVWVVASGRRELAWAVDWGPATWTGRTLDLSDGLASRLGVSTDDRASVIVDDPQSW